MAETVPGLGGKGYNGAAPKIHSNKFNTVMCDGHIEKLTFKQFQNSCRKKKKGGDDSLWRFR